MNKYVSLKDWKEICNSLSDLSGLSVCSDGQVELEVAINTFISLSTCLLNNVDIKL